MIPPNPRTPRDMNRLAKILALWVRVHEIPLEELAQAWGTSSSTVSRFLTHGRSPDGPTTARIIAWMFSNDA